MVPMDNRQNSQYATLSLPAQDTGSQHPVSPPGSGEMEEFIKKFVQLRGAASTIVLLLLVTRRPFNKRQLHLLTGITAKPIRRALDKLKEMRAVSEDENHLWQISTSWHNQFLWLIAGYHPAATDSSSLPATFVFSPQGTLSPQDTLSQPVGTLSQPVGTLSQPAGTLSPSTGTLSPSVETLSPSTNIVVVDEIFKDNNKDNQQQQQSSSSVSPSRVNVTKSPTASTLSHIGTLSPPAAPATSNKTLSGFLQSMGVVGRVYKKLVSRPDLILDPAPVLAWWYYSLAQEGIRQPAGLAIRCLQRQDPAPVGYLGLVRMWPEVTPEHRLAMEEMIQRNWGAEEMARYWSKHYSESTARTIIALKELYLANPAALGL
jgi:hypothetical protein